MTEITDDRYDFKKTVHRIGRSGGTFITNPQYILAFLRCPIDVSLFPFDQQFCNITVTDGQSVINVKYKGFGFHQVRFNKRGNDRNSGLTVVEDDNWTVASVKYVTLKHIKNRFDDRFRISVILQRKSFYYILVLVMPVVFIYFLSTLSFLLPSDSCDKLTFAITIFLAEVVTYSGLTSFLPESSDNVPILLYLLNIIMLHMGLICLASVVVVNLSLNSWRVWMGLKLQRFVTSNWLIIIGLTPISEQDRYQHFALARHSLGNALSEVGLGTIRIKLTDEEAKEQKLQKEHAKNEIRWKFFAIVVDRILLILHVLILVSTLLYFSIWMYLGVLRNKKTVLPLDQLAPPFIEYFD
ncbi:neuronal acetylcholine receptor subunit non-alpha-2-like [Convolutriloba macropyga]|uniref:neuronal acetylcholine receptor subunit non-alpha-2-like n=1 Tax=Convolutriloba macropyga TaxID=536237 RepID=UPI003F51C926